MTKTLETGRMRKWLCAGLLWGLLAGPVTAAVDDRGFSSWSISPHGIYVFPLQSDFVRPRAAEGEGSSTRLRGRSFSEVYRDPVGLGLTVDLWEEGARSFFVEVSRVQAAGKRVSVGTARGALLEVRPDDYGFTSALIGFRFSGADDRGVNPYFSVRAGAAFFDSIDYEVFANGQPIGKAQVFRSSTSFQGGVGLGLLALLGDSLHIGIESGIEIITPLRAGTAPGAPDYGVESFGRDEGLTFLPIRIFGGFRF